jgi:hypothetical protein
MTPKLWQETQITSNLSSGEMVSTSCVPNKWSGKGPPAFFRRPLAKFVCHFSPLLEKCWFFERKLIQMGKKLDFPANLSEQIHSKSY